MIDPIGYAAVKAFMIHGPCGLENRNSPCMRNFKCSRHFPKKLVYIFYYSFYYFIPLYTELLYNNFKCEIFFRYSARTIFDECGFPIYKRRNTGITVNVRKAVLDNQNVVPFNRDLLVKYQCHMNIEICCHARSLKYLFKYCLKGMIGLLLK